MADGKLQVIPLGGLGEFGMNSMALRYGDDILVIDAGMMFLEDELLGVDIVTPDFTYLEENREHVRALVLTHGHEDHIGATPFLLSELDIPVYGTAFTLALVERRLEEHDLAGKTKLNVIKGGEKVQIGPFLVDFVHVTHSIVSALALAISRMLGASPVKRPHTVNAAAIRVSSPSPAVSKVARFCGRTSSPRASLFSTRS